MSNGGYGGGVGPGSGGTPLRSGGGARLGYGMGFLGHPGGAGGKPTYEITKSVSYVASGTNSNQILSISQTDAAAAVKADIPNLIEVSNVGIVPAIVLSEYEGYSDEDTDAGRHTIQTMLMPGETFNPPTRGIIPTANPLHVLDGTVVDFTTTLGDGTAFGTLKSDSLANVDTNDLNNTTTPITIGLDSAASVNFFRVNDIIRVSDDVMRVLGTYSDDPTDSSLAAPQIRVERGLYGSAAEAVAGTPDVRFPFFNAYHDFDKYTVAQTDSSGRFKAFNFFGQGRASTGVQGIIPGSVAVKFYSTGYQELGLSGITSSSDTKLVAGGDYWFKIAIDGGTAESINFTVDSSSTRWGGSNGVISKINSALDDKYNNSASNTFQQKSSISIVGGDIRFTSGQRLSTSAIALTAGVDGASATYNIFAQQNGWFPALANIDAAVAAKLPDDVVYDRITYAQSPNSSAFGYDNGYGGLAGMCNGTINYETGAINMTGCPINAEFVVSCLHSSAFSGKLNEGTGLRTNSIVEILANATSQKWDGSCIVRAW